MSKRFNSQFKQMAGKIFAILFTAILITACGNTPDTNTPDTKIVTISGTVKDTAGMPVENIIVEVDALDVKQILSGTLREEYDSGIKIFYAVSDENGNYTLEWTGDYAANPSGKVIDVHFHVEAYKENDLDDDPPDMLYFEPVYYSQLQKTLENGVYYFSKTIDITHEDEEELTIPDGVTSIGESDFHNNPNLISVTIPASVTSIGEDAFFYCNKLRKVYFEGTLEQWLQISFGDVDSTPLLYHLYIKGEEVKDLVIPDGVTSIGDYTFNGCGWLESVTIPASVTSIGKQVFSASNRFITVNYCGSQEQWAEISIGYPNYALKEVTINYNYTGE